MTARSLGGRIGPRDHPTWARPTVEPDRIRQLSGAFSSVSRLLSDRRIHFDGGHPMRTIRQLLVFPLALLTMMASPAFADLSRQGAEGATADQHLVPPRQLTATV